MGLLDKFFGGPTIELLTFEPEDRSILFSSEAKLAEGEHKVKARVVDHTLSCRVLLETSEAELHYGKLLSPEEAVEPLSLLLPRPKTNVDQRAHPRQDRILRVSSPDLPGYQATTMDLSLSGAKLKTDAPLEVDRIIELHLEFDDTALAKVKTDATVRWSRQTQGHWLVGVEFLDIARDTKARLAYFLKMLTEVERGVLHGSYQVFD